MDTVHCTLYTVYTVHFRLYFIDYVYFTLCIIYRTVLPDNPVISCTYSWTYSVK